MKHVLTGFSVLLFVAFAGFTHADFQPQLVFPSVTHLQTTPIILEGTTSQTDRTNLPVATVTSFIPLATSTSASPIPVTIDSMSATPTSEVVNSVESIYRTERTSPLNDFILMTNPSDLTFIRNEALKEAFGKLNTPQLTEVLDSLDQVRSSSTGLGSSTVPVEEEATTEPTSDSSVLSNLTADELAQLDPLVLATILKNRSSDDVVLIISELPYDIQYAFFEKINIELVSDLPTPSPQPSPLPVPSDTPAPSPIPLPTMTFTPTEIVLPTLTFTVTDRPLPTNTNVPTEFVPTMTYTPTDRPVATSTFQPTQVVISPTYTVSPAYQASQTFTPSPIPPPTATRVPTLIPTPSPTRSS